MNPNNNRDFGLLFWWPLAMKVTIDFLNCYLGVHWPCS